jgi:Fe-S oxidoreductase
VRVLERLGVSCEQLNAGCCGLAGSFGYEAGQPYEVSMKAGERVLLPAVRAASPETIIVTDGFSCRHQISHGSERRALHLAQVVHMGMRQGPGGPNRGMPEEACGQDANGAAGDHHVALAALALGGAAAVAGLATRRVRQRVG